jgi:GMP synthase-like glutamine amidotransferase
MFSHSHDSCSPRLPNGLLYDLFPAATAEVEMWTLPGRCLACQFHPEVDGAELVSLDSDLIGPDSA